jgi:hypothetical protein
MTAAYVKPEVAHTVFGDKRAVAACGPNNPKALAVICDGGYRATGQWGFASGSRHAAWILGHCTVCESDGTPRLGPDGNPLPLRSMIFPKSATTMHDDWNVCSGPRRASLPASPLRCAPVRETQPATVNSPIKLAKIGHGPQTQNS